MRLWLVTWAFLLVTGLGMICPASGQRVTTTDSINNEPWFEHLSVNQGLSHNTVMCSHQDQEGFMWFGTKDGLNKYDGYTFTTYAPDPTNPAHTIGHSWVTAILEDQHNQLWVNTMGGGLYQIDKHTGRVTGHRISANPTNPRNTCFSMFEDQHGLFWIGSAGGLTRFDPKTGRFTLFGAPPGDNPAIFTVCGDGSGELWIGCATGLYRFNQQTEQYVPTILSQKSAAVFAITPGQHGSVWVAASSNSLYHIEPGQHFISVFLALRSFSTEHQFLGKPLWQDSAGMVWVSLADQSGLQRFDPTTQQWTVYRAQPGRSGKLTSNQLYSIYQDRAGILWVGTDNGIDKLMPQTPPFRTIQPVADEHKARLPQNRIRALCADHFGTIWVSNEAGKLYAYKPHIGRFIPQVIPSRINAIYEDHLNRLWLGTDQSLLLQNPQTGQQIHYRCDVGIQTIRESPDGKLWLSGQGGLAVFDPQTNQFRYYRYAANGSAGLRSHGLVIVLPSHQSGTLWIATNDVGLVKLNLATHQFTYYQPNGHQRAGLINDKDIRSLYEDANGTLWIGTNQGGLNRMDPKTGQFTAFTTHDGLPNNHIVSIQPDHTGALWLATNQGLCRFNARTKACRNYDQSDGLQDNEFSETSTYTPTGSLLFGGPNGFTSINPADIRDNPRIPPVYITQLQVLNQARPFGKNQLDLSYKENLLSFDFVALNFFRPEKNQYAYQLQNVDADWIYSGQRRFATYSNLAPGDYVFRVKAANNDGVWNEQGASLRFVIHPPFWRTGWFIGLGVLFLAGLLVTGFQYRIRQIRREEAQKTAFNKRLAETEMQALRAQMNPHFIFNSLNSINSFILDNEPEAASDYLSKFSKLIRLILQNSTHATVPLESELEALRLYLTIESLRFTHKFTFAIDVSEDVSTALTEIPPLIIQPYVENAIWHGLMHRQAGGQLTIMIRQATNQLICTIEDNGVGRQKAAELKSKSATLTKSLGMQITSHRLQLSQTINGQKPTITIIDLIDAGGEPAGTRVVLTIPVE